MAAPSAVDRLLEADEAFRLLQSGNVTAALRLVKGLPGSLAGQVELRALLLEEARVQQLITTTDPSDADRLSALREQQERLLQEALEAMRRLTKQLKEHSDDPLATAVGEPAEPIVMPAGHVAVEAVIEAFRAAAHEVAVALGLTPEAAPQIANVTVADDGAVEFDMTSDAPTATAAPEPKPKTPVPAKKTEAARQSDNEPMPSTPAAPQTAEPSKAEKPIKAHVTMRRGSAADATPVVHIEHVDKHGAADTDTHVDPRRLHQLATAVMAAQRLFFGTAAANLAGRLDALRQQPAMPAICLRTNLGAAHMHALCSHPDLHGMGVTDRLFVAMPSAASTTGAHVLFMQEQRFVQLDATLVANPG